MDMSFFKGKRILLTGHTGFKGIWLTKILAEAGEQVLAYSRCSAREPSIFALSGVEKQVTPVKSNV